jgi:hypothetical protein
MTAIGVGWIGFFEAEGNPRRKRSIFKAALRSTLYILAKSGAKPRLLRTRSEVAFHLAGLR